MSELLPCPHHKKAVYPKREVKEDKTNGLFIVRYICPICGWFGFVGSCCGNTEEEADKDATQEWNTRYERTCQMADNRSGKYASYDCQEHCYTCSSCYSDFTLIYLHEDGSSSCEMPVYCPTCGAKVVDEWAGK